MRNLKETGSLSPQAQAYLGVIFKHLQYHHMELQGFLEATEKSLALAPDAMQYSRDAANAIITHHMSLPISRPLSNHDAF
jgi:hypothetical protein